MGYRKSRPGCARESALVTRLENRLTGLERLRDDTVAKIERLRAQVAQIEGAAVEALADKDQ